MRRSHASRLRAALGLVFVLGMAACGGTPIGPAPAPDGTGAVAVSGAPVPSAVVAEGTVPPIDPALVAALGASEQKLRADDRTRSGLANLGPGAIDLAAQMDATGSTVLGSGLDKLRAGTPPIAAAPAAVLAALVTPGTTIQGPGLITTLGFEDFMSRIGSNPCNSTGPNCSVHDAPDPKNEIVSVEGNPGVIVTTMEVSGGVDGGKVTVDVTLTANGEVHAVAGGATIYRIEATGSGHVDGDACPDASGIAKAHIEFTASESYYLATSVGSAGYGLGQRYSADVAVHVDDGAALTSIDIAASAHEVSKGGVRAAGASQSDLFAHDIGASGTQSFTYDAAAGFTQIARAVTAPTVDALGLAGGMALYTEPAAKIAAKAMETAWRSGRCVTVLTSPGGGAVAKSSVTPVSVTLRQRWDGTEIRKPVGGVLVGVATLEPSAQQLAPAVFSFAAGSAEGDRAGLTFTSVSNRGIGTTTAHFMVKSCAANATGASAACADVFEASLTLDQVDHDARQWLLACPDSIFSDSGDETITLTSQKVRVDALPIPVGMTGWEGQIAVFVPHDHPFSPYGAPTGDLSTAPVMFVLPTSIDVNRTTQSPGRAPLPPGEDMKAESCLGGADGGDGSYVPPTPDCGLKHYDADISMVVATPNKLYPLSEAMYDSLYANCYAMADIPGEYVEAGGGTTVSITGGDIPAGELSDPAIGRIVIKGGATFLYEAPGDLETESFEWSLTLCRMVNEVPAC